MRKGALYWHSVTGDVDAPRKPSIPTAPTNPLPIISSNAVLIARLTMLVPEDKGNVLQNGMAIPRFSRLSFSVSGLMV
eukprot:1613206-Amphidinium_carterae.1